MKSSKSTKEIIVTDPKDVLDVKGNAGLKLEITAEEEDVL